MDSVHSRSISQMLPFYYPPCRHQGSYLAFVTPNGLAAVQDVSAAQYQGLEIRDLSLSPDS